MIKFAGINTLLPTPEVEEFISRHLDPEWSRYFYDASHGPNVGAYAPTVPRLNWKKTFQPRINSLIWPTGASRWASMLLLVTSEQLSYIQANSTTSTTYPVESVRPASAQLVLTDADYAGTPDDNAFTRESIEGDPGNRIALSTEMYALDPRPVSVPYAYQFNEETEEWEWVASTERTLWVLPIVDERWFWQWVDIGRPDDKKTWAGILESLAGKLSVTSPRSGDGWSVLAEVDDAYCQPIEVYADYRYANAAELMDAMAYSVGQRVVKRIDGTLRTMDPITAGARWNTNLNDSSEVLDRAEAVWQRIAGDSYGGVNKAPATVPESFQVVFQDDFAQVVTADEAGAIEWGTSGTRATIHVIGNGDGCSKQEFAAQAAFDYIAWLSRKADVTYAGIKCWEMTGFEDVVVWSIDPARGINTRIVTHPENLAMTPVGGNNTEVLYALPACDGVGIPAATDQTHPGKALCCLFWLKLDSDTEGYSPTDRVIRPLKRDGHHVRAWVYNPYPVSAKDCDYLPVGRMPSGSLTLLSSPPEVCAFDTSTTTTTTTSTTTTRNVGSHCRGLSRCRWEWNDSSSEWVKASGCDQTTTTSTTSSTTSSTTTAEPGASTTTTSTTTSTTTTCACPVSTTTSTSTSTTTTLYPTTTSSTTTTSSCQCQTPTFCGWEDGQCTYTDCSRDKPADQKCTTTTSTTTTSPVEGCNCATTCSPTTTYNPDDPAPPTCTQCGYVRPGYGPARFENGCSGVDCICPTWSLGSIEPCSSKYVDCQRIETTRPPVVPCTGDCVWWPIDGQYWLLGESSCSTIARGCGCTPPAFDPPSGCPGPTVTGCVVPNTTTPSTTGTPRPKNCCVNCNTSTTTMPPTSTTSSTTTTGCGSKCRWSGTRVGGWTNEYNPCPSSCPCSKPGRNPDDNCDTDVTPCGTGDTTSSTSSTTSTTTSTSTTTTTTTTTTTSTTTSTTTTVDPCHGLGTEISCGETPGCFWNGVGCTSVNCTICENLTIQTLCDQCPSCTWTPLGGCN